MAGTNDCSLQSGKPFTIRITSSQQVGRHTRGRVGEDRRNRQAQKNKAEPEVDFFRWKFIVLLVVWFALLRIRRIRRNALVLINIDPDIFDLMIDFTLSQGVSTMIPICFQFPVYACNSKLWLAPYFIDLHPSVPWQLDFCLPLIATAGEFPNPAVLVDAFLCSHVAFVS